jgi:expansin
MHFSSTIAASAVLALASGAVMGKRALSGEATFYGGNLAGGTCSFSTYTLPSGILGTALSDSNWNNAAECGACVSVIGPSGNSIIAMVFSSLSPFNKPILNYTLRSSTNAPAAA